ncbi:hypothetical protein AB0F81_36345 [Actinoplanes sp. NPDC024001]|uniref:hypothetical protein n=1 Tax=Actinoplanes sp. NPDC024001 TaxID=3154598 RepID=UPI0033FDB4DB
MIDRDQAVQLARAEVENNGLPWLEPVSVNWGLFHYEVRTNTAFRGGNVIIRVNRRSGKATVVATVRR